MTKQEKIEKRKKINRVKKKRFLDRMKNKMLIIFLLAIVCGVIIVIRVSYICVVKGDEYSERVMQSQNYETRTLQYARGNIVDRNGNILATNNKTYTLILEPGNLTDEDVLAKTKETVLNCFTNITEEEFDAAVSTGSLYYAVLKTGITYDEKTAFEDYCTDNKISIKGVNFEDNYYRVYPNKTSACHVIGRASADNVGFEGIEGYYNSYLNGTTGKVYSYLTSDGTVQTETIAAENGNTVVSTIDINIQKIIEDQIENYMITTGAKTIGVIAMDPDNGEILAMASSNAYDLNDAGSLEALRHTCLTIKEEKTVDADGNEVTTEETSEGGEGGEPDAGEEEREDGGSGTGEDGGNSDGDVRESTEEYKVITEENTYDFNSMTDEEFEAAMDELEGDTEKQSLLLSQLRRNFCISDAYEPGSTFKTFTMSGALEDSVVYDGQTFFCDGYEQKADYTIKCHNYSKGGCGTLTLKGALEQSCNDALMQIATLEGADVFDKYQEIFGFGNTTGIDLPGETAGIKYSAENLNETELATSSFGQSVSVTMVQMASAFCSVINGGNYYQPHVVKEIINSEGTVVEEVEPQLVRKTVSRETSDMMREYLLGVVTEGTGKRAAIDGYTIGGKTGTAEKKGRNKTDYVLSFIGFSPVEDPQIVLYVVVDSPNVADQDTTGAGAVLFHDIMEQLLPYLNVYQSSSETIIPDGNDELPMEVIDDGTDTAGDDATGTDGEGTDGENTGTDNPDEGSSENAPSEENTTERYFDE